MDIDLAKRYFGAFTTSPMSPRMQLEILLFALLKFLFSVSRFKLYFWIV